MSLITDTWRQLVRRRLWPVALGLLAALAAVPVVLARDPEVPPATASAAPAASGASMTEPVVALAGEGGKDGRRRVLGASKDPFTPAKSPKAKAGADEPGESGAPSGSGETTAPSAGGDAGSGGGDSAEPVSELPPIDGPDADSEPDSDTPDVAYPRYSASVRFGGGDEEPLDDVIERGEALPSEDDPVAIYLGVSKDGKRAVFMLAETATTEGDGTCTPSPENCEALELAAGETEFIDVTGEDGTVSSYQLDVVKIHKGKGAGSASSSKTAKAGLRSLRARELPYRYDARTGTVEKVGRRALKDAAGVAAQ